MKKLAQILKDESGQGATEYILLVAVVVGLVIMFREKITKVLESTVGKVGGKVQDF